MIYDFKNRQYQLLGVDACFTYMLCMKTKARIKVANSHFAACGFRSA